MYEQFGERFATPEEVRQSGIEVDLESGAGGGAGLPLLSDTKTVSVCDDDTHSLIIGGSGSKKNRLLIFLAVYLMAMNDENIVISDPKGETLRRTGSFLKERGYRIRVLDFRNTGKQGDYWNPLTLGYKSYKSGRTDEAQEQFNDFISAIAAPQKEKTVDSFWHINGSALGSGLLALLAEVAEEDEMNVGSFAKLCTLDAMEKIEEKLVSKLPSDSVAGINLRGVMTGAEKTKQSIYITLFGMIAVFLNQKNLMKALSNSTFDLEEIAEEKCAVFIVTPDEKSIFDFVTSLFVKQLYTVLIAKAQENSTLKLNRRVNFVLDEACNIPRIPDFTNMISAGRSRNVRFFLVIQSLHQLQAKYGEDEAQTIIGNCANIAFLHSRELPLLKMISELCGQRYLSDGSARPLITPSQLQRLDKDKGEILIFKGRLHPYITRLPDIDEYEVFKGYPVMELPESKAKDVKILDIDNIISEIRCGIRPVPFTEKEEGSYVEKYKSVSNSDDDEELKSQIEKQFDRLFGTAMPTSSS